MNTAQIHHLPPPKQTNSEGVQELKSNYTKLPHWITDSELPPYELAMLIQIARKTIGWGKSTAYISTAELCRIMGNVSKNTVKKAGAALTEKGVVFIGKTNGGRSSKTAYTINLNYKADNNKKGSRDDQFNGKERGHEMTTRGSRDDQFKAVKGSRDDHAKIKKALKEKEDKENAVVVEKSDVKEMGVKASDSPELLVELFNRTFPKLPKAQKMTLPRMMIVDQLESDGSLPFLTDWEKYFETARNTPFLMGDNKQGFRISFNWLINFDNHTKVMEGVYVAYDAPAESSQSPKLTVPKFDYDGATSLQNWATGNGFREANQGESVRAYHDALTKLAAERNAP